MPRPKRAPGEPTRKSARLEVGLFWGTLRSSAWGYRIVCAMPLPAPGALLRSNVALHRVWLRSSIPPLQGHEAEAHSGLPAGVEEGSDLAEFITTGHCPRCVKGGRCVVAQCATTG
jgi:hypothetical protein